MQYSSFSKYYTVAELTFLVRLLYQLLVNIFFSYIRPRLGCNSFSFQFSKYSYFINLNQRAFFIPSKKYLIGHYLRAPFCRASEQGVDNWGMDRGRPIPNSLKNYPGIITISCVHIVLNNTLPTYKLKILIPDSYLVFSYPYPKVPVRP